MVFVSFLPCFAEASSGEGCFDRVGSYIWGSSKIASEKILTELPPTNETAPSALGGSSLGETPHQMSPVSGYEESYSNTAQLRSPGEGTKELPKSFESPQVQSKDLSQSVSPQSTQLLSQPVCTQPSSDRPPSSFWENASPVTSAYLSKSAPIHFGEMPQVQPVSPTSSDQPTYPQMQTVQPTQINAGLSQQATTSQDQPVSPTSADQPTYPQMQTVQPTQINAGLSQQATTSQDQPVSPTLADQPTCPQVQTAQPTPINAGLSQQATTSRVQPVSPTLAAQPTHSQTPTLQPQSVGTNSGQFQRQPVPIILNTTQPTKIVVPLYQNTQRTGQNPYNQQTNPNGVFVSLPQRWGGTYQSCPSDVNIFVNSARSPITMVPQGAMAQTQEALRQNNNAINFHEEILAHLCEVVSKLYSRAIEHESRENVIETIDPEAVEFIENYIHLREQDTSMGDDQFTRYQYYFPRAFQEKQD